MIEARGNDQSLVSVLLAIRQLHLILVRQVFDDSGANISARRVVDLGADSAGFKF